MGARSWLVLALLLVLPSLCYAYSDGDSFLYLGDTGYAELADASFNDLTYTQEISPEGVVLSEGDFSVEAVLYIPPNTVTKRWGGILTKTGVHGLYFASYPGFGLGIDNGDTDGFGESIRAKVGDGTHQVTLNSPGSNGVVHLVVTWDRSEKTLTMYVKGDEHIKSATKPDIDPSKIENDEPFNIGFVRNTLHREIIYLRLWNRLLDADEAGILWEHYTTSKKHTLPADFDTEKLHSEWLMDKTSDATGNPGTTHIYDSAGPNHAELREEAQIIKGTGSLTLVSPIKDNLVVDTSVVLAATGGAADLGAHTPPIHYFFQIAEDPGFSVNTKESGWIAHFAEWKPVLKPDTTYHWRVKARDASGKTTAYTTTWLFHTEPARDWYVRPRTEFDYGAGHGTSYEDAWNGPEDIVLGPDGVEAGDNLYICGVHILKPDSKTWFRDGLVYITESGFSEEYPITIRMDCPDDKGLFWGYFLDQRGGQDTYIPEGDGVYSTTTLTYNSGGLMQDIDGWSGTLLKRVGHDSCTIEAVEASWSDTSGAWCLAGSTVYLKTTDGGDPTGRIDAAMKPVTATGST